MSTQNRIARIKMLGTLIMIWIFSGLYKSWNPKEITYEIMSRLDCPEGGVFLKLENDLPVVCGRNLEEIKEFFQQFGINELPGQLPCQPQNCFLCGSKCLALAA